MVKPVKHKFCVYIFWASHVLARDISNNVWGRKCPYFDEELACTDGTYHFA